MPGAGVPRARVAGREESRDPGRLFAHPEVEPRELRGPCPQSGHPQRMPGKATPVVSRVTTGVGVECRAFRRPVRLDPLEGGLQVCDHAGGLYRRDHDVGLVLVARDPRPIRDGPRQVATVTKLRSPGPVKRASSCVVVVRMGSSQSVISRPTVLPPCTFVALGTTALIRPQGATTSTRGSDPNLHRRRCRGGCGAAPFVVEE
jgi:hypothetical protein